MRRDILIRLALWILITESIERRRKDCVRELTATAEDIRPREAEAVRAVIFVRVFFARIVAASAAAVT